LRRAVENLIEEADYIARDDPEIAAAMLEKITEAVKRVGTYPQSGRPGRVAGTREVVVPDTPYILPYRIRKNVVEVLRVFHAARKWPSQF